MDTIYLKFYDFGYVTSAANLALFDNGNFGLVGFEQDSGFNSQMLFLRTDSLGNELWHHLYGLANFHEIGYNAFEDYDHTIIVSGHRDVPGPDTPPFPMMWRLDSVGNLIDEKQFNYPPFFNGPSNNYNFNYGKFIAVPRKNGNYLVSGYVDTTVAGLPPHAGLVAELDYNFNVVWRTTLSQYYNNDIFFSNELQDSSIVGVGMAGVQDVPGINGWIFKLDKHGQILWQRQYRYHDSPFSLLTHFTTLPNGDIVACGTTLGDAGNQDMWLIRLDSNGCLVDTCGFVLNTGVQQIEATPGRSFSVYPNPSNGLVNITLEGNWQQAQLKVYDAAGRLVEEQTLSSLKTAQLDMSPLSSGLYLIKVYDSQTILTQPLLIAR